MKKSKIIFTLSILLILFSFDALSAQKKEGDKKLITQETINEIKQRINVLEGQKDNLDKQSELLKDDFELKSKALNSKFDENKLEIDKDLSWLRSAMYMAGLGVLGSLLGSLLGFWIFFKKYIKSKSEEIANVIITDKVSDLVETNKDKIKAILVEYDSEELLKLNSKILVICENESDQSYMEELFILFGIFNVNFRLSNTFEEIDSEIDLIIFDDHINTNSNHDLFNEYLGNTLDSDKIFIFYGARFNTEHRDNLNYANSKFTLYNQIINSLKYQKVLNDNLANIGVQS